MGIHAARLLAGYIHFRRDVMPFFHSRRAWLVSHAAADYNMLFIIHAYDAGASLRARHSRGR